MNFEQELVAKKIKRKREIEKDKRDTKVILRYLQFYLCVIFILSIYSYFFDLIFRYLVEKTNDEIHYEWVQYIAYYIIAGYFIFPFSMIYNYFINNIFSKKIVIRIIAGMATLLLFGALLSGNYEFGYYIGEYRPFKNIIVLLLTGVTVELIRIVVIRYRQR